MQVKYFDKKKVYDEYVKKLEEKGYEPLPAEEYDPRRWHRYDVTVLAVLHFSAVNVSWVLCSYSSLAKNQFIHPSTLYLIYHKGAQVGTLLKRNGNLTLTTFYLLSHTIFSSVMHTFVFMHTHIHTQTSDGNWNIPFLKSTLSPDTSKPVNEWKPVLSLGYKKNYIIPVFLS